MKDNEADTNSIHVWNIDSEHTLVALMKLGFEYSNTWNGFQLPVNRLVSSPDISVLQQLVRSVKNRHHENSYIETSLFDKLYGMKGEYDLLCAVCSSLRTPTGVKVAKVYNGASSPNLHSDSI